MIRRYLALARTAVAEFVAADRALAENAIRELDAGIRHETPEFWAANDRVCDAELALPWWSRMWANSAAWRDHGELWKVTWELTDSADKA
ncbi:hypothetical protein [Kribbella sp. CA-247076]|uniref:hypothetical protein n=1 Tax=Kribbella sp. CA-247076 TaxID=3239941 RepID=UPI003D8BBCF2